MMQKRTALKLVLAGAAAAMLAGCGDKTEAPKEAAAPEKAAAAPADKAAGPYKVAFVYVSPASEEGWSRQHDLARIALEKVYGDKVKFTTVENIPAGADSERVLRDLAQQGNKLIFATSFGYMNSVLKVAKEFPDVKFEHATGYKTAPNVANYSARFYEARYLAGKLAGAMTKTNVLGYVAAVPIPEVLQGINAYTLGAQSVNPNVEVRVVWTSAWYDPGKESDAAKTLVGQKADVLTHHTDSPAVVAAGAFGRRGSELGGVLYRPNQCCDGRHLEVPVDLGRHPRTYGESGGHPLGCSSVGAGRYSGGLQQDGCPRIFPLHGADRDERRSDRG